MIESIRIGPIPYSVSEVSDLHRLDDEGRKQWLHGHIDHADAVIQVCRDQSPEVKAATLLHESIHGILNQAGMSVHDEAIVISLGYGLLALIRDNPALIDYIKDPCDGSESAGNNRQIGGKP